jgi:lipopolysaccharide transport system ATP-binding protein
MKQTAVRVHQLSKQYQIGGASAPYRTLRDTISDLAQAPLRRLRGEPRPGAKQPFWALRDISFEIAAGEVIGIIGRNGAGKSTLLKILSRITAPTTGRVELRGRVGTLLEVGTGFHPELTGRENVFLNGAILGMPRHEIAAKFDAIVEFAEVNQFIDTAVKFYSSGMYLRLAFAVAAHLEPEILIVDEVLAVGDAAFQRKCLGKMSEVAGEGRTVLFVSHNMQAVRQLCQRAILLQQGQVVFDGSPGQAIINYFGGGAEHEASVDLSNLPRRTAYAGAQLRSLRFVDQQQQPAYSLDRGEQLSVEVDFRVTEPMPQFDISMAVVHGDGTRVFSETFTDQEPLANLQPGNYRCAFMLETKYLKPETYFLTVYLHNQGRPLDHIDNVALPEIVDRFADSIKETHRWGVARFPVQWHVPKVIAND